MATIEQLTDALYAADEAGDSEAAARFADEIRNMQSSVNPPAKPAPVIGFKVSDIFKPIAAPLEVGMQMGSGMASQVAGGLRGLYNLASGGSADTAANAVRETQDMMTYQPRIDLSQGLSKAIAYPFEKGMEATKQAGGYIGEKVAGEQGRLVGESIGEQVIPVAATLASGASALRPSVRTPVAKAPTNQPSINAAIEAKDLGLVINPKDVNPTTANTLYSSWARPEIVDIKAAQKNMPKIQEILRTEAKVKGDILTGETLAAAREVISRPYNEVRAVGKLAPNPVLAAELRLSIPKPIVGLEKQVAPAVKAINKVADQIETTGMTASEALEAIKGYRDTANNWYKIAEKGDAKRNPKAMAEAYKGLTTKLEDLIEANLPPDSAILTNFRQARKDLAKNYTVEGLIDSYSGVPDLSRFGSAKLKDAPLEGNLAALRRIHSNYPEATSSVNKYGGSLPNTISRSSGGGTAGAAAAMAIGGSPGLGGIVGGVSGLFGGRLVGNRMLSPSYQAANLLPSATQPRVPLNPAYIGMFGTQLGENQ